MKKIGLLIFILFTITLQAQKKEFEISKKPIFYTELLLAHAITTNKTLTSWATGVELCYQHNKHLFIFRNMGNSFKKFGSITRNYLPDIYLKEKLTNKEVAILYGMSWTENQNIFSFSAGLSYNTYSYFLYDSNTDENGIETNYIGFPFEINLKRIKIYNDNNHSKDTLKTQNATVFGGGGFGLKVFANLNKHSYFGAGLTYEFGLFKK